MVQEKVTVATDFANIPGCTHIQIDKISKERMNLCQYFRHK